MPPSSKWGRFYYFRHDNVAKVRLLLEHGAALDSLEDEYRSTPLGLAARWGKKAVVEVLLARGADPGLGGAAWSTPLAWARSKGHAEIERMLVAAGAAS